ncbi:flagellar biosynthesis protein FliQ [Chitinimonas sp. PSY-7]|uniref:flagellar biosynthesis protein FliQ n=1 Tax=Chitinimonas sp. PSY-7 TaxID=3459088 RepID=UPI0040400333
MSPEMVITIIQRAFEVLILVGGPMLLAGLIVGLLISVFQAATQINEATLSFIPKLLITFLVAVLAGPWMLSILMDYTVRLYQAIPTMVG